MSSNYTSKTVFGGWKNHKSVDKYIYVCKTCDLKYETFCDKTDNGVLQFILHTDMCYAKDQQEKLEQERKDKERIEGIILLLDSASNTWDRVNNRNNRNNHVHRASDDCVIL